MNDAVSPPPKRRAIVAGFGPVGRMVTEHLERNGFDVTLVEVNTLTILKQRSLQRTVVEGDVTLPATLKEAGIESADALILTIPNEDDALRACQAAHAIHPEVFISARTNFVSKGMLALQSGADHVVIEEMVTAEAMGNAVTQRLCP